MTTLTNLTKLLEIGKDSAILRFSLGSEYLKLGDADAAVEHLKRAVEHNRNYSAAWKLLGRALQAAGRNEDALDAYREGIAVAEKKGDKQAAKEMNVFARRLQSGR